MAVILDPRDGEELVVNWWTWRPTVALLGRLGVLPPGERTERCLVNGSGGHLTAEEAEDAAEKLGRLLESLPADERVRMDGSSTCLPRRTLDLPVSEWTDEDERELYAADHSWLARFSSFCRRSGGFEVL